MIKRIFVKSVDLDSAQCGEIEAEFLDDKEWKIVINCGETNSHRHIERSEISKKNDEITITFFALENDIDSLVRGYLGTFLGVEFGANLARENNMIFVDSPLSKDEILTRLAQKDIIQSCEQISLNDKKIERDLVIMPFNGSRASISREILESNRDFFANDDSGKFLARIVRESSANAIESFDSNPKNAIYKAIGKVLDSSLRDSVTPNRGNPNNLLDTTIFLNFRLEIECLKILLLQKCTFIVCAGIPSFSVVRFAQKFGITLIAFTKNSADLGAFLILTHQMRFVARI